MSAHMMREYKRAQPNLAVRTIMRKRYCSAITGAAARGTHLVLSSSWRPMSLASCMTNDASIFLYMSIPSLHSSFTRAATGAFPASWPVFTSTLRRKVK